MSIFQSFIAMIGRMCISLIFIVSAISQMINWQNVELSITNAMCDWMGYGYDNHWIQTILDALLPWIALLLVAAFVLQLLGGLLVFIGIKVRLGAFLLLLFIIPATLLFHFFWMYQDETRDIQLIMFLKNISIFGALLVLLAFGKGPKSPKAGAKESSEVK